MWQVAGRHLCCNGGLKKLAPEAFHWYVWKAKFIGWRTIEGEDLWNRYRRTTLDCFHSCNFTQHIHHMFAGLGRIYWYAVSPRDPVDIVGDGDAKHKLFFTYVKNSESIAQVTLLGGFHFELYGSEARPLGAIQSWLRLIWFGFACESY